MARWKARVRLPIRQLFSLAVTVEALQGKTQDFTGRGRSWATFFGFYKTRHILLSNCANCTVLRAVVLTQYRRVTDRQTDGRTAGRTDRRNCCS